MVRADGPQWVDDGGGWYPLGGTLFWALRGVKYEPARLKENQAFLAKHGCDYQRILGHVEWPGNEIDWTWAIAEEVLGHFLDYSFNEFGLRTEVALLGTYSDRVNLEELVARFCAIVASRPHTVLAVETCNEGYQNGINGNVTLMESIAGALRDHGLEHLLALSSAEGMAAYGLTFDDVKKGALLSGGADKMTVHWDRGQHDDGCHFIRQPYDYRDLAFPIAGNEPIGPRSSVAECMDPLQLAMLRANALVHGQYPFVIHNGAGVAGQVEPAHNRPANLWEVPGIDAIMQAVRNVDRIMPPNVGVGQHWNNQTENPFRVTTIWPEDGHGANRRYCVEHADGFVCPTFGIVAPAEYVCRRACHIEAYDPVLGAVVQTADVAAGGVVLLRPSTLDYAGHGGLIVRGTYR